MSSDIQLCDIHNQIFDLIIREKRVYQGQLPSVTEIFDSNHHLPMLNSTLDQCSGQCIRGNLDNWKDFVCLCPRCYHESVGQLQY
ncbi:unnamed protein product [Rotaria sp. Silwood1]|nr:unnamed protein product [Rotaria sp. Silwood1]